jgi:hypothetical protein
VGCHTSTTPKAPTVQFSGPTEVAAQALAAFQFTVHSRAPATQRFAGFDVAASGGLLVPGTCNGLPGDCQHHVAPFTDELTHIAPQGNDVAGDCIFEFTWQAPSTPGNYILYGAGNSVNGNFLSTGDKPAVTTFTINVLAGAPSETPTVTSTATPPTVNQTPTATNTATVQPTDTPPFATEPPTPSQTETPTPSVTETPTTTSTPVACIGDCNQDRRVTTDELLVMMRIALGGIDLPTCKGLARIGPVTVDLLLTACNQAVTNCASQ